jgi:hypothetical protein
MFSPLRSEEVLAAGVAEYRHALRCPRQFVINAGNF